MTKGAIEILKNKVAQDIDEKRRMNERYIESQKLAHDKEQQSLNRQNARKIAREHDIATIVGSSINTAGKIAANDPAWYKRYLPNADEFVRIPTFDRVGSHTFGKSYFYDYDGSGPNSSDHAVPGIMVFRWMPTVGYSTVGTNHAKDPINQTLARLKEKVLALNSRSSVNWEPADLGFNFMCSADIMVAILELGRAIRVYQTYHAKNAYLAEALITAIGFNYSDMVQNYAEYRKVYTLMARKFNSSIVAPLEASFYQRRAYLAANIFADSDDPKEPRQFYAFREDKRLVLDNDALGCTLDTVYRTSIVGIENGLQTMFERITDNPDFVEMYQDLRHAFGNKLVQLATDIDNETCQFNTLSLNREQIQNLMVIPAYNSTSGTRFANLIAGSGNLQIDSAGYLYQVRKFEMPNLRSGLEDAFDTGGVMKELLSQGTMKHVYNMYSHAPTGDDILDITRFSYSCRFPILYDATFWVDDCGTELIYDAQAYIYRFDKDPNDQITRFLVTIHIPTIMIHDSLDETMFTRMAVWTAFDWAPISTYVVQYDNSDPSYNVRTLCEAHTTFTITGDELRRINEVCVMSEFYVPDSSFGKWN